MPTLRESFGGSLTALLATLEVEALQDKVLPLPSDQEEPPTLDYSDEIEEEEEVYYDPDSSQPSSTDSLTTLGTSTNRAPTSPATTTQPTVMTKRVHALRELLSSERAYASDLALIRDVHIPLALGKRPVLLFTACTDLPESIRVVGQPSPFITNGMPSPPSLSPSYGSGLSPQAVSTASNSSTASSQLGPPMTPDDVRIIFSNISDLAKFSDHFVDRLEEALGGVLDNGTGEDRMGALLLEIIPTLEHPYKIYITRHPTALAHLNALPSSPALSAYLSHTHTLASSWTHAWDLPSLLVKPVQRLLMPALVKARSRMEELTRSVNEDCRRREVVREVLGGAPIPTPNGTGKSMKSNGTVNVRMGAAASAHLSRIKSLRGPKPKGMSAEDVADNTEAVEVARLESELQRYVTFLDKLAKNVKEWRLCMHQVLVSLWEWGITFGPLLGLTPSPSILDTPRSADDPDTEGRSEAYDAFILLLASLPTLCGDLEQELQKSFIPLLSDLKTMMEPPTKLLSAMHSLEPFHAALLHAKSRRPAPALLIASQSYLALRSTLLSELPILLKAMNKATGLVVRIVADKQAAFYTSAGERWAELWDALRVDGEVCGGADETLHVWWERWGEAEAQLSVMKVTHKDKWWAEREELWDSAAQAEKECPLRKSTGPPTLGSLSNSKWQSHQSQPSMNTNSTNRRRSGSTSVTPPNVQRRCSVGSSRSGKSVKSTGKSGRSGRADEKPPVLRRKSSFSQLDGHGPQRRKSNLDIPPMQTTSPQSSQALDDSECHYPPSPPALNFFDAGGLESEYRGRTQRRSSLKSKLTDTFRPTHHRRRSSSVKSLGAHSFVAPSYHSTDKPLPPHSPDQSQPQASNGFVTVPSQQAGPSHTLAGRRALYTTRAIHPCLPPIGISYRGLPFFQLAYGDSFDVLREYGHPATHVDLPLYVDDGWALASFLLPTESYQSQPSTDTISTSRRHSGITSVTPPQVQRRRSDESEVEAPLSVMKVTDKGKWWAEREELQDSTVRAGKERPSSTELPPSSGLQRLPTDSDSVLDSCCRSSASLTILASVYSAGSSIGWDAATIMARMSGSSSESQSRIR